MGDGRKRGRDKGEHVQEEKRPRWCERDQANERLWKKEGKRSWSSVSQLTELPSSSGGLLVICGDVSPPVERLSHHIVQRALIRQPWLPGVLISIARGRGNPRQGPAGHLITAAAPSSPHPYSPPSFLCPHPCPASLTHSETRTTWTCRKPSHAPSRSSGKDASEANHFGDVNVMALVLVCCGSLLCYLIFFMALRSVIFAILAIPWPALPLFLHLPALSLSLLY